MNTSTEARFPNDRFPNDRFPNDTFPSPQPSGSKKGWLLGGCGCLSLLGILCLAGGGLTYFKVIKPHADFAIEAMTLATENPQVKETLGEPLVVDHSGIENVPGGNSYDLRIPVKGSKGSGVVVARAQLEGISKLTTGPMTLEFEGETIDLDPDAATPVPDIKIGDD